jgi:hypothetical protein
MTRSLPRPLAPLANPVTIDDVLANIDLILEWSRANGSKVGYFAVLYKKVTVGIKAAVEDGVFDDGARIERLDVDFAQRYFNALNAFFHPRKSPAKSRDALTLPWEVCFVGDGNNKATMLQHMLAGLNAHITFDLAPATLAAGDPHDLGDFEDDFNRVNAVLGSQIPGMLKIVGEISPAVRQIRWAVPDEVYWLQSALRKMRRSAWEFAIFVANNPHKKKEKEVNQAAWVAALGAWYLDPPAGRFSPFPWVVHHIGRRENPRVSENMDALLAAPIDVPDPMTGAFLFPAEVTNLAGKLLREPLQISESVLRTAQRIPSTIVRAWPTS